MAAKAVGDHFYADDSGWIVVAIDKSLKQYEGDELVSKGTEFRLEQVQADGSVKTRSITNWKAV